MAVLTSPTDPALIHKRSTTYCNVTHPQIYDKCRTHSANDRDVRRPDSMGLPAFSLVCVLSLDSLLTYRQEHAEVHAAKRCSSTSPTSKHLHLDIDTRSVSSSAPSSSVTKSAGPDSRFRSIVAEAGFCFSIAMTQLISEVFISGFALVLMDLLKDAPDSTSSSTSSFWPAALLSLVISSTLLVWARLADMYGGYLPFMAGLLWLTIWSAIPGLTSSLLVLNISRAMQGLAIASWMPSVFVMLGSVYEPGPRKNMVFGIYGACAPLGFYLGFVIGGLLPVHRARLFFLIMAGLALFTFVIGYLSIPSDQKRPRDHSLEMDWFGALSITGGLILIDYALAVIPYQAKLESIVNTAFELTVLLPLVVGAILLAFAIWVEGWYARCPLLPFTFFQYRGVMPFCWTCIFFYSTFGIWIYNTSGYFTLPNVSNQAVPISGPRLVAWYTPLAVSGIIFCVVGGAVSTYVAMPILITLCGLAWIGAPLVMALGPVPLQYWSIVLPSMLCASLGTDLTFTVSNIFLSNAQPEHFQGLAGAMSSILFNIGVSFSLPVAQIVFGIVESNWHESDQTQEDSRAGSDASRTIFAYRVTFLYAALSAAIGLLIYLSAVLVRRLGKVEMVHANTHHREPATAEVV